MPNDLIKDLFAAHIVSSLTELRYIETCLDIQRHVKILIKLMFLFIYWSCLTSSVVEKGITDRNELNVSRRNETNRLSISDGKKYITLFYGIFVSTYVQQTFVSLLLLLYSVLEVVQVITSKQKIDSDGAHKTVFISIFLFLFFLQKVLL